MKRGFRCITAAAVVALLAGVLGIAGAYLTGSDSNTLRGEGRKPLETAALPASGCDEDGYRKVAGGTAWDLFLRPDDGNFYTQNRNGTRWYANPEDALEDENTANINKMELASSLVVQIFDLEKAAAVKKNSETACVRKDGLQIYAVENGFRADYTFTEYQITIPVEVTLQDDQLRVCVITSEIIENNPERYILRSLSLLPNFGAAGKEEQGYVFMPDGCGALMYFQNQKPKFQYTQSVYGRDMALTLVNKPLHAQAVSLPVFGIKKDRAAFVAMITQGDTSAVLHAVPNGYASSYGLGYAEYILRTEDSYVLDEENVDAQTVTLFQEGEMEVTACEQRYGFLEGEDADYNGMARCYRDYLIREQGVTPSEQRPGPVHLDFYAAVRRKESVAGFPVERTAVLSTVSDIAAYTQTLQGTIGRPLSVRLMEWSRDGIRGKLDTSLDPEPKIGSASDIRQLSASLGAGGGGLSLGVELLNFRKNGQGVTAFSDAAKTLSNSPATQYTYLDSTRMKDPDGEWGYLVNPLRLAGLSSRVSKAAGAGSIASLSPFSLSRILYGSYGTTLLTKEDTKRGFIDTLKTLKETCSLVLDSPASYALPYADAVVDAPLESSGYDVMDAEVPFYQLVMSGLRPCASVPVNLHSDPEWLLLKAITTGTSLHYDLITGDTAKLVGSRLNSLYSADADAWADRIALAAAEFGRVAEATQGTSLIRHTILQDDVYELTYENGAVVLVNMGREACVYEGESLPARSYLLKGVYGG